MGLFQSKEQQPDAAAQHAESTLNTVAIDTDPTPQDNEPKKLPSRRKRDSEEVSPPKKISKRRKTTLGKEKSSESSKKSPAAKTPTKNTRKSQETPSLKKTGSANSRKKSGSSQKIQTGRERHTEMSWETKFRRLLQYQKKNGDCLVPAHYKSDPALGNWVHCQRQLKRTGELRDDRFAKLESIGFAWNARKKSTAARKATSGRMANKQKK
jgi:outer membrane biosynthesis protein TonB